MKVASHLVFLGWCRLFTMEDDAGTVIRGETAVGKVGVFATPNKRALYLLQLPTARTVDKDPRSSSQAAKLFRTWSQREPEEWFRFVLPDSSSTLWKWGYASELVYRSDKWNREPTDYIHRFDRAPVAYADRKPGPKARPKNWGILATDGRPLVSARGIIG